MFGPESIPGWNALPGASDSRPDAPEGEVRVPVDEADLVEELSPAEEEREAREVDLRT
jgi:hypothetical protein